jgi:outer membrane protein assembly factor BamB
MAFFDELQATPRQLHFIALNCRWSKVWHLVENVFLIWKSMTSFINENPIKTSHLKMKTLVTTWFTIFLLLPAIQLSSQPISEWRGEDRSGVSPESGLMEFWPESGPELAWQNLDLPKGFSSMSFSDDCVFLTGIEGDMDVVLALDARGEIKWKTPFGRAWTDSFSDSRSTPTIEGDFAYVASGFGDLACLNIHTGEVIWSLKASETYGGTYGQWGLAESLLIDEEKLYFTPGGPETTTIALNKENGDLIWKSPSLKDNPAYVSPILIDYAGKKMLVNVSASYVFGVDTKDGSFAWTFNHLEFNSEKSMEVWSDAPQIKAVTPLFHKGQIYITGGYDHGSFLLELSEKGDDVSVRWYDENLDVHLGGVVLVDGYIYGSGWTNNSDGNWCCLDWETGELMYEEHWKCKGSVISADDMLYIYDEKRGNVGLLKPNPAKFDLISTFRVTEGSGPHWAHPAIHDGKLYIRHGNALMAYHISK